MKRPRVLVIGSANMDLVATVPRSPKPGESIIGTNFKTVSGGKGANQAVAAARLGAMTYFAGFVGQDTFGEALRYDLHEAGANTQWLKTHPTASTGVAMIFVAETGQNCIVVVPSANLGLTPDDIEAMEPVFEKVDVVLLQLEIPLDTVEAALDMARCKGVLSILDAGPAQRIPAALVEKADIVSPNETELEAITGVPVEDTDQALEAAMRLRHMGARETVVKLGAQGALYLGAEPLLVPAYSVTPVDTTAAGDAFTAALGCVWHILPRHEAIQFANAVGALATTVAGAQPSMPTLETVRSFLVKKGDVFFEHGISND